MTGMLLGVGAGFVGVAAVWWIALRGAQQRRADNGAVSTAWLSEQKRIKEDLSY